MKERRTYNILTAFTQHDYTVDKTGERYTGLFTIGDNGLLLAVIARIPTFGHAVNGSFPPRFGAHAASHYLILGRIRGAG